MWATAPGERPRAVETLLQQLDEIILELLQEGVEPIQILEVVSLPRFKLLPSLLCSLALLSSTASALGDLTVFYETDPGGTSSPASSPAAPDRPLPCTRTWVETNSIGATRP